MIQLSQGPGQPSTAESRQEFSEGFLYIGEFVDQGRGRVRDLLLKAERPADIDPADFNPDLMHTILTVRTYPEDKPISTANLAKVNGRSFDRTELITDEELRAMLEVPLTLPGYCSPTTIEFIQRVNELQLNQTEKDRLTRLAKKAWGINE